ncbi:hypothetical protein [Salinivibrio sp. VYel4]|uniref:hypothetical protein n=1 Tax=Salinivibrio sp. VYel4 TaxID=2490491 RepID=UPI00128B0C3E|nr:hypothetical protein [Salinivibrio sp. VYel4]MPY01290.1 hypothetical protein [Salinivibrio sp. VYel4]
MSEGTLPRGQKAAFTKLRNEIKEEHRKLFEEIENKKTEIERAKNIILIDDDEGISLQSQILEAKEKANQKLADINNMLGDVEEKYIHLTNESDGYYPEINEIYEEIQQIKVNCIELMNSFQESEKILYGENDDGLESQLKTLSEKYEKNLTDNSSKSKELINQIEGALRGATNVELAKAFKDQKESYTKPKNGWAFLFIITLAGMTLLAINTTNIKSEGIQYVYELIKRLMVFGPLIWLALFSSKQQSQNKRLEQEYAHKEAVAKTFIGHQRQLEKLSENEEKDRLLTQLAETTIETVNFNPSTTLESNNHKEDLPASELLEIIKKLTKTVEKK